MCKKVYEGMIHIDAVIVRFYKIWLYLHFEKTTHNMIGLIQDMPTGEGYFQSLKKNTFLS